MLQRRDDLRVGLEGSHEVGILGERRSDDLDGDISAFLWMHASEDGRGRSVTDLLHQPVAAERFTAREQPGILPEDPFVQPGELGRWVDAQLVRQEVPCTTEGCERVGLPAVAIQGEEQQRPQALPEGMLRHQRFEDAGRTSGVAAREQRLASGLLRIQPQVVQPGGLGEQGRLVREIGEGGAPPHPQRILEHRGGDRRVDRQGLPRFPDEGVEPVRVEFDRLQAKHVAGRSALEAVVPERPAQVRHVRLQGVPRLVG